MGVLGSGTFWLGVVAGAVGLALFHRYAMPMPSSVGTAQ